MTARLGRSFTHPFGQICGCLDLDVRLMDCIRAPEGQRDEAVLYEYVPECADTLVCLCGCDVCPRRLLMQRRLERESGSGTDSVVSRTGHICVRIVYSLQQSTLMFQALDVQKLT